MGSSVDRITGWGSVGRRIPLRHGKLRSGCLETLNRFTEIPPVTDNIIIVIVIYFQNT